MYTMMSSAPNALSARASACCNNGRAVAYSPFASGLAASITRRVISFLVASVSETVCAKTGGCSQTTHKTRRKPDGSVILLIISQFKPIAVHYGRRVLVHSQNAFACGGLLPLLSP